MELESDLEIKVPRGRKKGESREKESEGRGCSEIVGRGKNEDVLPRLEAQPGGLAAQGTRTPNQEGNPRPLLRAGGAGPSSLGRDP